MLAPTLFALLLAAPGSGGPAQAGSNAEARAIRAALKTSERTIDGRIQQMTSRAPFALLGLTRGLYLAGYGAVFTVEVNLVPVANISPFRPPYTPQEVQNLNRQKREKLDVLKSGLRQLLAEQSAALTQIPPTDKVAIVVSLFSYNWEDTTGLPSQLVLQAPRQPLAELQARHAGAEALERAIELREF